MRKVTLVHLDLGIGGAEQLMVSIGCAFQKMGYKVKIITSHHDPNHCFEETKPGGKLGDCVEVCGDWLPRRIFGKCTAFCAILRMIFISIIVVIRHLRSKKAHVPSGEVHGCADDEIVFMDGVSASLPLFFLAGMPTIFYCHFPDKLLCTDRESFLKRMYRTVIDTLEEITTGSSSLIVVNSKFTATIFRESFPSLTKFRYLRPTVLYPTVEDNLTSIKMSKIRPGQIPYTDGYDTVFLSLNRYERKKNIILALDALHHLKTIAPTCKNSRVSRSVLLVVAGGYDITVCENVEYLQELQAHCASLNLPYTYEQYGQKGPTCSDNGGDKSCAHVHEGGVRVSVVFRTSIPTAEREALLSRSDALLYTPDREHFGIVPIEAMYAGTPVICVASGGPLETVLHEETGFLCKQDPTEFAGAMLKIMADSISEEERRRLLSVLEGFKTVPTVLKSDPLSDSSSLSLSRLMGEIGKVHVQMNFTSSGMIEKLSECIENAVINQKRPPSPYTKALQAIFPIILLNIIIFIAIGVGLSVHFL